MTRAADRFTGRSAPPAADPFATRAFGTTKAQAAAIAAAASAARSPIATVAGDPNPSLQAGGRASGATGGAGATTNLTTSTYGSIKEQSSQ